NLGTPGAPNSRLVSNAAPVIYGVGPSPLRPAANEPVVVVARVNDPDGVASVTLRYRIDPNTNLFDVPMRDDGTGGDLIAGDGLYSATLPAQAANTMAAFHIRATDGNASPAVSVFPRPYEFSPQAFPNRECLVRFGETNRPGSIGTYRIWVTSSNVNYWTYRERNSNEGL